MKVITVWTPALPRLGDARWCLVVGQSVEVPQLGTQERRIRKVCIPGHP
jgi:hypothetical protein